MIGLVLDASKFEIDAHDGDTYGIKSYKLDTKPILNVSAPTFCDAIEIVIRLSVILPSICDGSYSGFEEGLLGNGWHDSPEVRGNEGVLSGLGRLPKPDQFQRLTARTIPQITSAV
jgi:hypothetical protein